MMNEMEQKIVENLLDKGLPEDFKQEKDKLLAKLTQEPSQEAIKTYSIRKQIDLTAAKQRLEENYRKEVEDIEFKEIALRLSNAMKVLSPKMLGLEQRELGREEKAKQALAIANAASAKVDNAVREVKEAVHNAKADAYVEIMTKINRELDLSKIVNAMINLEEQNRIVHDECVKLKSQIREMKENTLVNRIKRFFGLK
jgi:hypothetical protein